MLASIERRSWQIIKINSAAIGETKNYALKKGLGVDGLLIDQQHGQ